jgi:hypothetical protein
MDPVIVVSGNWVKKNRYVFNADGRGCRVVNIDEKTTLDAVSKIVLDDYGLKESSHQIQLSYMLSNKALKTMPHDTPPVYLSNTRQLHGFLSLRKIEQLRLCVEFTELNYRSVEKEKSLFSDSSEVESRLEEYCETYDGFSFDKDEVEGEEDEVVEEDEVEGEEGEVVEEDEVEGEEDEVVEEDEVEGEEDEVVEEDEVEGEEDEVVEEDEAGEEDEIVEENEVGEEDEEEDEFDSRFDMFEDTDGESSEDDNFSLYGEAQTEDEDSPTLPPKKRSHNFSKGNPEVQRVDMASLNLSVGQRFESKDDLEKHLKLLTVRDRFDFNVDASDTTLLTVKCWVDGCQWRVRATTLDDPPAFYIRIYDSDHTCSVTERSSRSRKATPDILGELYKDFLGDVGPSIRARSVGVSITKQFGVKVIINLLKAELYK